ncbi:MAG: TRAP transporter small permease subunit [Geminicoccaceae bacterium]|nr:TRAP transporter small permease subunit [Geminicoccaceae bacterium]MCS7268236.1 TRAP transporter small permease subunit [Geminicoccaceae bacterium]MCX7629408.1 TRAP transporter small permease subunit [Geminicoccaceae bacterium]MDW8124994.1 TRAP transporter small permease subunit [Geminicoccaceae bacterium]MDW8341205.1 TRAP transporter small permease subunit [Geminicoccaceae bacterium]
MERLLRASEILRRIVEIAGRVACLLILPMILVTVWDVVSRKSPALREFGLALTGGIAHSTILQELEWHLHTALFALCLGYGYVRNAHVRVDLILERLAPRSRAWIELFGCLLFMLPYTALVIWFAFDFARTSWINAEASVSLIGIPHRWVIKSVLLLGLVLAFLAGLAVLLRIGVYLFARRPGLEVDPWVVPVESGRALARG